MARDGKRRIVVEFLGDDKSLSGTAQSVEGTTSKLGSRLKKVGLIAGAGLAVGVGLAAKGLYDMGKAAAEDAQGQAVLAKALQNNAGATKQQIAATEDWITAQGKALGVADDQLRPALGNLVRATGDVGKAQKLASLAMDVSAGSGKDLGAISQALAKAQNGNVGALGRLGIATKDAQGKTKSFAQIQDELAKKFGGSAAAKADTFAGRMGRLSLMFDEAKESIGAKLLPVAERLAGWFMDKGLPAIREFSADMQAKLGPAFDKIRDIAAQVMPQLRAYVVDNFAQIRSTFESVVSIISSLWAKFGDDLTAYAIKGFENLRRVIGGALDVIAGIFKVVASLLKGDWSGVWDGLKQITSGALQVIRGLISQAMNIIRTLFRIAWTAVKAIVSEAWQGIKSLVASGAGAVVTALKAIPGKIKALGGLFKDAGRFLIQQMIDGLKNAAGLVSDIAGNIWDAVKGLLNNAIDKINNALEFGINKGPVHINVNPPDIPHLAKGGVVRRPTLALIGEAGPEAVVPLSGPNAPRGSLASAMGGGQVVINISGALDPNAVARQVHQMLSNLKRTTRVDLGLA